MGVMGNLPSPGYFTTSGSHILDQAGDSIRLAGVNWYGFECNSMVIGGLGRTTIETTCGMISSLGFNCIRMPFCVQAVVENPPITHYLGAEPGLQGKTALEILDEVVGCAGRHGLRIILDSHRGSAGGVPRRSDCGTRRSILKSPGFPPGKFWFDATQAIKQSLDATSTMSRGRQPLKPEHGRPTEDRFGGSVTGYSAISAIGRRRQPGPATES